MNETDSQPGITRDAKEPSIRYTLGGGRIGVSDVGTFARTIIQSAVWLYAASIPPRLLQRMGAHRASAVLQRWWARRLADALRLEIDWKGMEHVDPDEAYVVLPLHEGFADVLALLQLPVPLRFVVRDEISDWRLLDAYLRNTKQIAVRPESGARAYRQILREAREVFARGESLVIFPQGTILGIETAFLPGAFAVARALQRPILPIALTGSHRVWEHPFSPRLRYGERMSVSIQPPITAAEVEDEDLDTLRQRVQKQLKSAALSGEMASPRHYAPARDGYWDGYAFEIDPAFTEVEAQVASHRAQHVSGEPSKRQT